MNWKIICVDKNQGGLRIHNLAAQKSLTRDLVLEIHRKTAFAEVNYDQKVWFMIWVGVQ